MTTRTSPHGAPLAHALFLSAATLLGVLGAAMAVLGIRLLTLGGTPYYLACGVLLLAGAWCAWRDRADARSRRAIACALAALALTLAWSLVEIAGKGWPPAWGIDLAGRAGLLGALVALMGLAWCWRRVPPRHRLRRIAVRVVAGVVVAGVAVVAIHWERPQLPAAQRTQALATAASGDADPGDDWLHYGGTNAGRRHSTLAQIGTGNVGDLRLAWSFRSGDTAPNDRVFFSSQNTPIKAGDLLYLCTSSQRVHALDPGTGQERWRHDPQVPPRAMESLFSVACRAVGYHAQTNAAAGERCARRVFVATADGRLLALDAADGRRCEGFGTGGSVDLTAGMGKRETGFASNTSGPTVAGDVLLVGQQVSDNQRRDAPSGVVRAYDAVSGQLRWAWDALRPDAQAPLAPGAIYPRGTPNVWNVISADTALGLAFLGTGNPGADHWGGTRSAAEDAVTAAVVAVDLATGATRWAFRTVEHDLWDYDLGAQPLLLDLAIDGQPRRALVQGTKSGDLYVLDARTGQPLRPVAMRLAPQGALPGERLAPRQPRSTFYPNHGGVPGRTPERIDARHAFGLTPVDAALCRIEFHRMRYEGLYTPPTEDGLGMLLFPGTIGGLNWGGLAFDPARRLLITNNSRLANRVTMVPRAQVDEVPVGSGGARPDQAVAPHALTPWGVDRPIWLSKLGVPCNAPPWGFLSATHVDTGELVWSQPLGTGMDTGPLGLPMRMRVPLGTANIGGPLSTAGGLTFIAAAQDDYLRAFETGSGRLLWSHRLPAGGQAGPMTYRHQGRQYVAIVATGHARLETTPGDHLLVFALPAAAG